MRRSSIVLTVLFLLYSSWAYPATYQISGTSSSDDIFVGTLFGYLFAMVNGTTVLTLPTSACQTTTLNILGNGGADDIDIAVDANCNAQCKLWAGSGNDTVTVIGCDGIVVYGGTGHDYFELGTENNPFTGTVYGENGNDSFYYHLHDAYLDGGDSGDDDWYDTFQGDVYGNELGEASIIYGGPGPNLYLGAESLVGADGVYISGPDDDYFEASAENRYYGAIFCDSQDFIDRYAIVENISGNCE